MVADEPIWRASNVNVANESKKLPPHKFYEKVKSASVIIPTTSSSTWILY